MAKSVREVEITAEVVAALEARAPNCFLCRWILEDLVTNKKLTGYPLDYNNQPGFPISGKVRHLELEGFIPTLDHSIKA